MIDWFGSGAIELELAGLGQEPQQEMLRIQSAVAGLADPAARGRLRLYRPAPTAAFSRRDTLAPGYSVAHSAATGQGFSPVTRPAGGRLACYHRGCLVLDLVAAHPYARQHIRERFRMLGRLLATTLREIGVTAGVGAVPGEYCPGEFSVNAGGRTKLAGTAQRLTRYGYLISAVLVITDPEPIRAVLHRTYPPLGLRWDPATVGCVSDHVPGITVDEVERALVNVIRRSPRMTL